MSARSRRLAVIGSILAGLVMAAAGVVLYATGHILPYSPVRPYRVTKADIERIYPGAASPEALGLRADRFDFTVEDSIRLRGWFIHAGTNRPKGTVILLHGIASCKEGALPTAAWLAGSGYNCIAYDSRANGESGGEYCTFGYYEKRDAARCLDSALVRFPGSAPFALFGNSLGAAVTIQAMAEDGRIRAGIAESPFADLRDVVYDSMVSMFKLPVRWVADRALDNAERIARFPVDSVSPRLAARRVTRPVLVIHGTADSRVAIAYGRAVYDNLAAPEKEWMAVEGGGHDDLAGVGGEQYRKRVLGFLEHHLTRDDSGGPL